MMNNIICFLKFIQ